MLITHDLGVVAGHGRPGRGHVRRAGSSRRAGPAELFARPRHPYTAGAARLAARRLEPGPGDGCSRSPACRRTSPTRRPAAGSPPAAGTPPTGAGPRSRRSRRGRPPLSAAHPVGAGADASLGWRRAPGRPVPRCADRARRSAAHRRRRRDARRSRREDLVTRRFRASATCQGTSRSSAGARPSRRAAVTRVRPAIAAAGDLRPGRRVRLRQDHARPAAASA